MHTNKYTHKCTITPLGVCAHVHAQTKPKHWTVILAEAAPAPMDKKGEEQVSGEGYKAGGGWAWPCLVASKQAKPKPSSSTVLGL